MTRFATVIQDRLYITIVIIISSRYSTLEIGRMRVFRIISLVSVPRGPISVTYYTWHSRQDNHWSETLVPG